MINSDELREKIRKTLEESEFNLQFATDANKAVVDVLVPILNNTYKEGFKDGFTERQGLPF